MKKKSEEREIYQSVMKKVRSRAMLTLRFIRRSDNILNFEMCRSTTEKKRKSAKDCRGRGRWRMVRE